MTGSKFGPKSSSLNDDDDDDVNDHERLSTTLTDCQKLAVFPSDPDITMTEEDR